MSNLNYRFKNFHFDPKSGELTSRNDEQVTKLDPKVAELLCFFLQHPNQVLTKQELLDKVWQGAVVTDNSLSWALSQLRKSLGDKAAEPVFIKTLPKKGYQFLPRVSKIKVATPEPEIIELQKPKWQQPKFIAVAAGVLLVAVLLGVLNSEPETPLPPLSNIRTLTNLDGLEEDPMVSPSGQHLMFRHKALDSTQFKLYIHPNYHQGKRQFINVANDDWNYLHMTWSSKENELFAVRSQTNMGLVDCEVVKLTLTEDWSIANQQPLTTCHPVSATKIAFQASNNILFFTDKRLDNNFAVYRMDLTTDKILQVTDAPLDGLGDHYISLHPSEKQLLILRDSYWANTEFRSYQIDNGKQASLLTVPSRYYSADFGSQQNSLWLTWGNQTLINYDYKTKQRKDLLSTSFGWNYNLSPTHAQQALFTVADANAGDLQLLQGETLETWKTQDTERRPALAPDGKTLAYISNQSGLPQIWLKDMEQQTSYQLSQEAEFREFSNLIWSPSGNWLLVTFQNRIQAYNLQKELLVDITEFEHNVFYPGFSQDGNTIYFSTVIDDVWQTFQLPFKKQTTLVTPLLPEPAWLTRQLPNGRLVFSKPHQSGLFIFNPADQSVQEWIADFPANDYWQLTRNHIYYRQTIPEKVLMKSPIDEFDPEPVKELNPYVSELFTLDRNGTTFLFESQQRYQSDIKIADVNL